MEITLVIHNPVVTLDFGHLVSEKTRASMLRNTYIHSLELYKFVIIVHVHDATHQSHSCESCLLNTIDTRTRDQGSGAQHRDEENDW